MTYVKFNVRIHEIPVMILDPVCVQVNELLDVPLLAVSELELLLHEQHFF